MTRVYRDLGFFLLGLCVVNGACLGWSGLLVSSLALTFAAVYLALGHGERAEPAPEATRKDVLGLVDAARARGGWLGEEAARLGRRYADLVRAYEEVDQALGTDRSVDRSGSGPQRVLLDARAERHRELADTVRAIRWVHALAHDPR